MPRRAYIRLATDLPDRKRDYPDGAFRAFVTILALADGQPLRGQFHNTGVLRAYLGRLARWVPYLESEGDLQVAPDGQVYVVGWAEWQEGDLTVAERMRRLRARRNGVTAPVTDPVTDPNVTSRIGRGIGISRGTADRNKGGVHNGQHGRACLVCAPLLAERDRAGS